MNEEKIKILIADDDESIRTTLEFILLDNNFNVVSVHNGAEALVEMENHFFNIAILDYNLPDTDGLTLSKKLKNANNDAEVIILTGQATLESAINAVKENIYDYLTKPVDPEKLIEVINSALEKQRLILENKRLLWELKKSNKEMERLINFKDGLISMISHDLRSPISSLKGFNYSLLEGYAGELTEKQKEIIHTENKAIEVMMELINNLLDIRQIEAGELIMKKELTDVKENIVEPVVNILKPQAAEKNIAIEMNFNDSESNVVADYARIAQVLQNLIQNALKFTPKNGRITVNMSKIKNDQIELRVSDTGKGILKESLASIFDAFYTTGENGDGILRDKAGRGLGLSICKEIVKAHDGAIWAESDGPGTGSTFVFVLPIENTPI
jgi:signal transduction histidine kinase